MPSSDVCRCLFRLMRRYFLGRWICLLASERLRLVWQCCPFGCNTKLSVDDNIYIYIYIYVCPLRKTNTKCILTWHLTWLTSKRSVNIKTYLSLHISLKTGGLFWSLKNTTFSSTIPRAINILNSFKLRTLNARLYLFRYIHFIGSCYLDKHPSPCKQFLWYQSPDEVY